LSKVVLAATEAPAPLTDRRQATSDPRNEDGVTDSRNGSLFAGRGRRFAQRQSPMKSSGFTISLSGVTVRFTAAYELVLGMQAAE